MTELKVGDGCGLKLNLSGVGDIAAFNSGGRHPSTLRSLAVDAICGSGMPIIPDDVQDRMGEISKGTGNLLQPGLDAGYSWIEEAGLFSVSTTDAMTPPTDNPGLFGKISALHVLSDLWVSGVEARTMQQYLVVPRRFDGEMLGKILRGFKDTCDQFGATITGGHTRQDGDEYLLGGTATGYTHKRHDTGVPRAGDLIVVTKALGTSLAIAALKMSQQCSAAVAPEMTDKAVRAAEASMATDNHIAVSMREDWRVSSCTDITGFGLVGHLSNLLNPVGKGAVIEVGQLPVLDGAAELLEAGVHTRAGDEAQIEHAYWQDNPRALHDPRYHLAFLPETSGGVLATVRPGGHDSLAESVKENGQTLTVIGEVALGNAGSDYRFAGIKLV